MEKVLISLEGNYILLRNVAEIKTADGDKRHFMEVRIIGDQHFTPVMGKSTILIDDEHLRIIDSPLIP